ETLFPLAVAHEAAQIAMKPLELDGGVVVPALVHAERVTERLLGLAVLVVEAEHVAHFVGEEVPAPSDSPRDVVGGARFAGGEVNVEVGARNARSGHEMEPNRARGRFAR